MRENSSMPRKIPNDADFERASRKMEERRRSVGTVSKKVKEKFGSSTPFHDSVIWPGCNGIVIENIFFKKEKEIEEYGSNGSIDTISDFIDRELRNQTEYSEGNFALKIEVESDEMIQKTMEIIASGLYDDQN